MANDTLILHHGGMSMLKSTTSSLDTSFTELSSHEVKLKIMFLMYFISFVNNSILTLEFWNIGCTIRSINQT